MSDGGCWMLDAILSKLKDFAEVFEVIPVVSVEYAQQRIFQELS